MSPTKNYICYASQSCDTFALLMPHAVASICFEIWGLTFLLPFLSLSKANPNPNPLQNLGGHDPQPPGLTPLAT
jgi:hypothetical protein